MFFDIHFFLAAYLTFLSIASSLTIFTWDSQTTLILCWGKLRYLSSFSLQYRLLIILVIQGNCRKSFTLIGKAAGHFKFRYWFSIYIETRKEYEYFPNWSKIRVLVYSSDRASLVYNTNCSWMSFKICHTTGNLNKIFCFTIILV